jgi:hypothetical protein
MKTENGARELLASSTRGMVSLLACRVSVSISTNFGDVRTRPICIREDPRSEVTFLFGTTPPPWQRLTQVHHLNDCSCLARADRLDTVIGSGLAGTWDIMNVNSQ